MLVKRAVDAEEVEAALPVVALVRFVDICRGEREHGGARLVPQETRGVGAEEGAAGDRLGLLGLAWRPHGKRPPRVIIARVREERKWGFGSAKTREALRARRAVVARCAIALGCAHRGRRLGGCGSGSTPAGP